jgi:peptidoglycan glycosyltransferase
MTPYIIDCIQSETGKIYTKNFPTYEKAYLNETLCSTLKQMLVNVVTEGTASVLYTPGLTIGGKTGTAQNETNEDHSWFIGFVTDESHSVETLAFAVIVENGGKGSQALTVSKKLIKAYQNLKKSS